MIDPELNVFQAMSELGRHDFLIALYCFGLTTDQPEVFRFGFDTAPPDYEGPVSLPVRVQEPGEFGDKS